MPHEVLIAVTASGLPSTCQTTIQAALAALIAAHPGVGVVPQGIAASGFGNPTTGRPDNTVLVVTCLYTSVP